MQKSRAMHASDSHSQSLGDMHVPFKQYTAVTIYCSCAALLAALVCPLIYLALQIHGTDLPPANHVIYS